MPELTEQVILDTLRSIKDPDLHRDVVSLGFIRDIRINDGHVSFDFVLTTPACPARSELQQQAEATVGRLPGVKSVSVEMKANVPMHHGRVQGPRPVEGVRHLIAIASNKGGVGKSTVAVNLAVALARAGARTGLVDADITGPNIPTMMGFEAGFQAQSGGLSITERYGVRIASIGFVLPKGSPVVWRGPMIGTAVRQLLHDLPWGELDYLIVDLPPGTSDASMSMAQEAPISGVVIVTTPQSVSIEDASKAVTMFDKLQVPVFGLVENMSYFLCPHCGERTDIFGHGGARNAAEELGLEFLGEIPIDVAVREGGDSGQPIVHSAPDSPGGRAFVALAEKIAARVSTLEYLRVATV